MFGLACWLTLVFNSFIIFYDEDGPFSFTENAHETKTFSAMNTRKLSCFGVFSNFLAKRCMKCLISWKTMKNRRFGQNEYLLSILRWCSFSEEISVCHVIGFIITLCFITTKRARSLIREKFCKRGSRAHAKPRSTQTSRCDNIKMTPDSSSCKMSTKEREQPAIN